MPPRMSSQHSIKSPRPTSTKRVTRNDYCVNSQLFSSLVWGPESNILLGDVGRETRGWRRRRVARYPSMKPRFRMAQQIVSAGPRRSLYRGLRPFTMNKQPSAFLLLGNQQFELWISGWTASRRRSAGSHRGHHSGAMAHQYRNLTEVRANQIDERQGTLRDPAPF